MILGWVLFWRGKKNAITDIIRSIENIVVILETYFCITVLHLLKLINVL